MKKAFTMIELIAVLTIISFIVIAELVIITGKANEYGQSYYTTYNALKKANYNVLADIYCPDNDSVQPICPGDGPRPYPTTPQQLCSRLTEFINTSEQDCANLTVINDMANNINTNNPAFIASNSFRFYFGNRKEIKIRDMSGFENILRYFVVYVDINGEKRPNRVNCDGSDVLPDIVPFALTTRGEVIPMGLPVYSNTYLTAKIKYPGIIEDEASGMINKSAHSMSFYEAAFGAWPNEELNDVQVNFDIPYSIMLTQDDIYNNSNLRQCYNGSIRKMKTEEQYKDEAKRNAEGEIGNSRVRHIHSEKGCAGGTYSCRVIIDSSINSRW